MDFRKFSKVLYNSTDEFDDVCINNHYFSIFKNKTGIGKAENADKTNLSLFMKQLREIKTDKELELMKKAIDITCSAHKKNMQSLKPGMFEYQIQANIEHEFQYMGCEFPAFPSIVGGGKNTCILHYETNRMKLESGNLVVVDIGGEYHGYAADVTRTLPVNGKFSNEQKIIYNLVLEAQTAGIKSCLKGNDFAEPGRIAKNIISKGLLELGIIEKESDYIKYFMHGTSHYLGLDVHDIGNYGQLTPGNVITVEPGIYIPENSDCDPKWWNIGVRIEDDVLITEETPVNLSEKAPKTVEEIEKWMLKPMIEEKK